MTVQDLNRPLKKAFTNFLEYTPPQRLSRNLRNMLVHYMLYDKDACSTDMDDLLCDLLNLFRLLDIAADEWPAPQLPQR